MLDLLEIFLTAGFWAATLRIVSPLVFGTLGELICERAGVLNLGIEGIMTMGAMCGWMWVYQGGDLWIGFVALKTGQVACVVVVVVMTVQTVLAGVVFVGEVHGQERGICNHRVAGTSQQECSGNANAGSNEQRNLQTRSFWRC